jgi:hypothetical protein
MIKAKTPLVEARRLELAELYREFHDRRFPGSRGYKETDLLHTLMIQYDAEIALGVERLLDDPQSVDPSGLREDEEIEQEIKRLVSNYPADSDIGRVARNYSDYYGLIKRVLEAAESYLDMLDINPV